MIVSFLEYIAQKTNNSLNELRLSYIYKRTPKRYKDRAEGIDIKLITKTKRGRYYYETTTRENGNKHKQWLQLFDLRKNTMDNLEKNVIVHCNCNDFRYENEWLLWTKDSSNIISSNGKPLKKMNPERIPKFCKHLAAIKEDFYNRIKSNK